MGVLSNLEPKKVFSYFEEITQIPHGSGNVARISDYLVKFAVERNLRVIQDEWKNVIIFQEATAGYEKEPPVILQGHMDMVAVKKPESRMDMCTEGLQIAVEGDFIYAKDTSLGGDDGIAVAYALALLDSDEIAHPRLEVVITVDEEVGMDGAREIDLSMLEGNRLLNLDSEEEGILITGCAGGARTFCRVPYETEKLEGVVCHVTIQGLLGGHSGEEIGKDRGNSNILMGRIFWELHRLHGARLQYVRGGLADNAIPRRTEAGFVFAGDGAVETVEEVQQTLRRISEELSAEFAVRDPELCVEWRFDAGELEGSSAKAAEAERNPVAAEGKIFAVGSAVALTEDNSARIAAFLMGLPNGVQNWSAEMPGLVETSLNLGILMMENQELVAEFLVRSSVESAKQALLQKLGAITAMAGGKMTVSGEYPGWKYRADSPLREKMIRVYREMYGTEPEVKAIHAGLECGILGSKIPDSDCVSIGPDMQDIHTTEEKLSISSTRRVWEYLVKFLGTRDS